MTTVAFDGRLIACDSQVTTTSSEIGYATKGKVTKGRILDTVAGPVLVIGVGLLSEFLEAIPYIEQGTTPHLTQGESEILMVKDGLVYLITSGYPNKGKKPKKRPARARVVPGPDAWGSGDMFAQMALRMDADAPRAVATACVNDLYSGGHVHAWSVASLSKVKVSQKKPKIV